MHKFAHFKSTKLVLVLIKLMAPERISWPFLLSFASNFYAIFVAIDAVSPLHAKISSLNLICLESR